MFFYNNGQSPCPQIKYYYYKFIKTDTLTTLSISKTSIHIVLLEITFTLE